MDNNKRTYLVNGTWCSRSFFCGIFSHTFNKKNVKRINLERFVFLEILTNLCQTFANSSESIFRFSSSPNNEIFPHVSYIVARISWIVENESKFRINHNSVHCSDAFRVRCVFVQWMKCSAKNVYNFIISVGLCHSQRFFEFSFTFRISQPVHSQILSI